MLRTPKLLTGPILHAVSDGQVPVEMEEGVLLISHFNLDLFLWDGNEPVAHSYMGHPWLGDDLRSYGVCDTPEAFLALYRTRLMRDTRTFVISFTHIEKDTSNAGRCGGWRWHKWGPYIGNGKPTCEYLDDVEGFERGVYVYTVLQTDGPEVK